MNYLSAQQVADRLSISIRTIRQYIKNGKLPSCKIGKLRRISEADLEEFIEKRKFRGELETLYYKQQYDLIRDAAQTIASGNPSGRSYGSRNIRRTTRCCR